ncbi:MAG: hypothetical protein ACTHKV_03775 [Flavipsychrobacter sp.]
MARRPRDPIPFGLQDLKWNFKTDKYEKTEDGITYAMDLELTRHLKEYYRFFPISTLKAGEKYPTMQRWYQDLSKDEKKKVTRTGNLPPEASDFFPDPDFSE